jgi:phage protein D
MAETTSITHTLPKVTFDGTEVAQGDIHALHIELDLDQPDMCTVMLSNTEGSSGRSSDTVKLGAVLEVETPVRSTGGGGDPLPLFYGEVTGVEPVFEAHEPSRVLIRAYGFLHQLSRGTKSQTFTKMTDKQILEKLISDRKLTPDIDAAAHQNEHVYQQNQTDLEIMHQLALRNGFSVWGEKKKILCKKRTGQDSGKTLDAITGSKNLERFAVRLSAATQVKKVEVRGWDPVKKEKIVGAAVPGDFTKLGDKLGTEFEQAGELLVSMHGTPLTEGMAKNVAQAILEERMMGFITGEGKCAGDPALKPGLLVTIDPGDKRFKGKYYLVAVHHIFTASNKQATGFHTSFKVRRNAASNST